MNMCLFSTHSSSISISTWLMAACIVVEEISFVAIGCCCFVFQMEGVTSDECPVV